MTDFLTVLSSSTNKLAKAFSGTEFKELRFSQGELFDAHERSVCDLEGLRVVLRELEAEPTKGVIRV